MPMWGLAIMIGLIALQLVTGYTIFRVPGRPGEPLGRYPSLIHRDEEKAAFWVAIGCQIGILLLILTRDFMLESGVFYRDRFAVPLPESFKNSHSL